MKTFYPIRGCYIPKKIILFEFDDCYYKLF